VENAFNVQGPGIGKPLNDMDHNDFVHQLVSQVPLWMPNAPQPQATYALAHRDTSAFEMGGGHGGPGQLRDQGSMGVETAEEAAWVYDTAQASEHGTPPAPPTPSVAEQFREDEGEKAHGGPPVVPNEPKKPRKRQRNDCLPEEAQPPASIKRKADPKKEKARSNTKVLRRSVVPTPDTKATATKTALASSEDDEEEASSSSFTRPAKRARTTITTRHSGGLDIQAGERLEVEWNGIYYPATVYTISLQGLPNVM